MDSDPFVLVRGVIPVLDRLGIPYLIGGSVASIIHGIHRATNDLDLLIELPERQVSGFVAALESEFFVDESMVRDEVHRRGSFNIIHRDTSDKVDFFLSQEDEWAASQFTRKVKVDLEHEDLHPFFCSAEDIVLQKLKWYRLSHERSDKQWGDITGVLKVQDENIDKDYLQLWAAKLGIADLLDRALIDSGLDKGDST